MTEQPNRGAPRRSRLRTIRILIWVLVGLALAGSAALLLVHRPPLDAAQPAPIQASFGGPFTLVGGDGKPFASSRLAGKPYALFFGFTNCGDVCPTTLARLVKLRQQAGGPDKLNIVFITIDPERDGPKEVGQYATLFNAPIIGLTGSPAQIDRVRKQYGIHAEKMPTGGGHDMAHGAYTMNHSSAVLLFDRDGQFISTISSDESDPPALDKIRRITA
jgi:protein SCO1/2